jgi:hypothetical protein
LCTGTTTDSVMADALESGAGRVPDGKGCLKFDIGNAREVERCSA